MKTILVTGIAGLVGCSVAKHFSNLGWHVIGLENNQRADLFGNNASIELNINKLRKLPNVVIYNVDITDTLSVRDTFDNFKIDLVVHTAAQPSHDLASTIPLKDFNINSFGTLNLLESVRKFCPESPFVFLSTNKVYGDNPNKLEFIELKTRYQPSKFVDESMSIDHTLHSLFGVSKTSADLYVQEYGRYFNIPTVCLRCGCITGENHMGAELHGFLSYLVKCQLAGKEYTIYGYNGKQVRDNIHADDIAYFCELFYDSPKCSAVYNLGGGEENSISIVEAFAKVRELTGKSMGYSALDTPRVGDHKAYITNLKKIKLDYPTWSVKVTLDDIFNRLIPCEYS